MKFLHYEVEADEGNTILVSLDSQANVRLMDSSNFHNYRNGRAYRCLGGRALKSPCPLTPPHAGIWHVVIDLGGYSGSIRASVRVA